LRYRARVDLTTIGFPLFDIYVKSDATVFLRLRNGAQVLREHKPIPWQEAMLDSRTPARRSLISRGAAT
jgi:hypothetical protein